MDETKQAFVSIYCKIYTDNFSDEMINREATGKEIYNFLMKDAGLCGFDENSDLLPGDANIWYVGSCEKFGSLVYKDRIWNWGFGESSFDIVEAFVQAVYEDGLFTIDQYKNLMEKIREGRMIGDMYAIRDYLIQKSNIKRR